MKMCPDNFGELPLTGVLPNRDSEIRGAIVRIAKTNKILKSPLNKLFPIENTYQNTIHSAYTKSLFLHVVKEN